MNKINFKLIFSVIFVAGCAQGSDKIPDQLSGSFGELQGLSSTDVSPKVVNLLPEQIVKSEEFSRAKFLQNEDYAYSRLFLRNEQLKELAKVEKNLASFPSAERHARWHLMQDQDCEYRKVMTLHQKKVCQDQGVCANVGTCLTSCLSCIGFFDRKSIKFNMKESSTPEVKAAKLKMA